MGKVEEGGPQRSYSEDTLARAVFNSVQTYSETSNLLSQISTKEISQAKEIKYLSEIIEGLPGDSDQMAAHLRKLIPHLPTIKFPLKRDDASRKIASIYNMSATNVNIIHNKLFKGKIIQYDKKPQGITRLNRISIDGFLGLSASVRVYQDAFQENHNMYTEQKLRRILSHQLGQKAYAVLITEEKPKEVAGEKQAKIEKKVANRTKKIETNELVQEAYFKTWTKEVMKNKLRQFMESNSSTIEEDELPVPIGDLLLRFALDSDHLNQRERVILGLSNSLDAMEDPIFEYVTNLQEFKDTLAELKKNSNKSIEAHSTS